MQYLRVSVNGVSVRVNSEGRYNLNDLHAVAVADSKATESQRLGAFLKSRQVKRFVQALSDVTKSASVKEVATSALNRAKMEHQFARGTNAEKIALDNLIATKSLAKTASLNYTQALTAENVAQRALTTVRRQSKVATLGMRLYKYSENVKQANLESIEFAHSLDTSTEALNKMSNATLVANLSKVS